MASQFLKKLARACESGATELVKKLVGKHEDPFNIRFEDGKSLLHIAAEKGHLDLVVFLTEDMRLSSSLKDDFSNTPLHDAAYAGHLPVVQHLIENARGDPTCRGEGSCTALHTSCQGGQLEVVQYLISQGLIDPLVQDEEGDTPLHYAASHGKIDIVKFYYERVEESSSCVNNEGSTPLHLAALNEALEVVQYLVSTQHYSPTCESNRGCIPLHAACEGGSLDVVKYLVEEECSSIMQKDVVGKCPLHYAAQFGHLNIVRYLAEEKSCDIVCQTNSGNTPLHLAAANGYLNVVTYLTITRQCSPVLRGEGGWTALHAACQGGHLSVVQHLVLEQNINPMTEDDEGMTPLHMATMNGQLDLVKFLVEARNCSSYHRNNDGNTSLHLAAGNGHLDVVKYLVGTRKCDPTSRGQADYTTLHAACQEGHLNVVKYLITEGVDPSIEGINGITAFDIAVTKGYHDITRFLRKSLSRVRHNLEESKADSSSSHAQLLPFTKRKIRSTRTVLGRGMFGTVHEVDMEGDIYAAKLFHSINNEKLCRKLSSEVNILSNVRHPHVVRYYGLVYFPDKDIPALLMERLMTNLHSYILEHDRDEIPLPKKFALLCNVASGLSYLHNQSPVIVHRDLTAKNVLLDTSLTAKIADFGNSRIIDLDSDLTPESMTAQPGTLDYMPPEAFGENPEYDTKLDMFSFGHLALFVLTGAINKLLPLKNVTQNRMQLRSEWERRSTYHDSLFSLLGKNHLFLHTIQQCLSDDPTKRSSASILRVQLIELSGNEYVVNRDEVLSATLTMKEMSKLKTQEGEHINIIHRLAPKWQQFGNLLRFDSDGHTLDIIAKDHTTDGCVVCCQEVATLWLQGRGRQPATWALLLELLEDMEQGWLAEQVKNSHRIN